MVNKINIITNKSGIFHIYVYVPAGSIYEISETSGCSHILEHMLFKNKGDISINLSKSLTTIGAKYNAATYKDVTYYYIKTYSDKAKESINLIGQIIQKHNFNDQELNTERKVIIEEYNQTHDGFDYKFYTLANRSLMHDDNIYLSSVIGDIKVLKNIKANELKAYYKDRYKDIMVFVNCDQKIKGIVKKELYKVFGTNQKYDFKNEEMLSKANLIEPKLIFINKPLKQYVTRFTFLTFPADRVRDHIILRFLQYCLTASGLYSLLNHNLREIRGLVYTIHSYSEKFRYTGFYYIQLGSSSNKTDYIISLIINLLSKLKNQGLPDKVLKFYKNSYLSSLKVRYLDEEYRTENLALSSFYDSFIEEKQLYKIIKGLTNDEIKDVSKKAFDYTKMGLLSIGEYNNVDMISKRVEDIIDTYGNKNSR